LAVSASAISSSDASCLYILRFQGRNHHPPGILIIHLRVRIPVSVIQDIHNAEDQVIIITGMPVVRNVEQAINIPVILRQEPEQLFPFLRVLRQKDLVQDPDRRREQEI